MDERTYRILVVDDQENVRETVSIMLSLNGYGVVETHDGKEAVALFLRNHIDLVLTGLEVPGMDEFMLASIIKNASPETPTRMAEIEYAIQKELKNYQLRMRDFQKIACG